MKTKKRNGAFASSTFIPNKMEQTALAPSSALPTKKNGIQIYDTAFSSSITLPTKKKLKIEMECTASAPTTSLPTKDSSEMD